MTTVWYVNDDAEAPEEVACDVPGYPNRDAKGRTMYVNSHCTSEAAAWDRLLDSGRARQDLAASAYAEAQRALQRRTEDLAEAAARRTRIEEAFEAYKRRGGE
jgi:hypothetical protein